MLRRYIWIWKTLNRANLAEERERERTQNLECFIVEGHLTHYKWYDYKHAHTTYTKQLREREGERERESNSLYKEPSGCISLTSSQLSSCVKVEVAVLGSPS